MSDSADFEAAPLAAPPTSQAGQDFVSLIDGMVFEPRRLSSLTVTVIRPLAETDLLDVLSSPEVTGPTNLATIRHHHHRIAQLIVEGAAPTKVSFITGYSPSYIARLKGDPVFLELLAYYASQAEVLHVDTIERMKNLGTAAMEELAQRLEEKPEEWTRKDLMELAKVMTPAIAPGPAAQSGPVGPSVALHVQFVNTTAEGLPAAAPALDLVPRRIPPEQEI